MRTNIFQRLILCFSAAIMDGVYSDEEHFLIQKSFSEEILQHNFSINYILDSLVFTKFVCGRRN